MTFLCLKMIIFGHFSRFLASFKISFSSLQHPNHIILSIKKLNTVCYKSVTIRNFKTFDIMEVCNMLRCNILRTREYLMCEKCV